MKQLAIILCETKVNDVINETALYEPVFKVDLLFSFVWSFVYENVTAITCSSESAKKESSDFNVVVVIFIKSMK
ncbi:hypothetical protein FF38_12044 [Lucilia cuprina]|uniref:Uncharacterized protein n=1 Tax=Lucilia cuprina TaxID=7375 RepID=A0A0L0CNY6_LUCCU|nr:hypothetical protein FF38_12044 [Lucilia cuprina]